MCISGSDLLGDEVDKICNLVCDNCKKIVDKICNEEDIDEVFNKDRYCDECQKKLKKYEEEYEEKFKEEYEEEYIESEFESDFKEINEVKN